MKQARDLKNPAAHPIRIPRVTPPSLPMGSVSFIIDLLFNVPMAGAIAERRFRLQKPHNLFIF